MNVEEFERFFISVRSDLVAYARFRLDSDSSHDAAIQTLQAIWLKNIEAPRSVVERRQLMRLTYKILDGQISNIRRGQTRYLRLIEAVQHEVEVDPPQAPDPADVVLLDAPPSGVMAAISALPSAERQVVSLVAAGYKVGEIATILGLRPNAISMRLTRARENLRGLLDERRGTSAEDNDGSGIPRR